MSLSRSRTAHSRSACTPRRSMSHLVDGCAAHRLDRESPELAHRDGRHPARVAAGHFSAPIVAVLLSEKPILGGATAPLLREPAQQALHADVPAPIHRRRRPAQPATALLNRQTLCQGEQYVSDVGGVAGQRHRRRCIAAPCRSAPPGRSAARVRAARDRSPETAARTSPAPGPGSPDRTGGTPGSAVRGPPAGAAVSGTAASARPSRRKPSKYTARTKPALSVNNSYTAGTDVCARSATRRVVNPETPSSLSTATATSSTRSASSGVRCFALGTAAL